MVDGSCNVGRNNHVFVHASRANEGIISMKNIFPGTRTVFYITVFYIVLSTALDVLKWTSENLSGFGLEVAGTVLLVCVSYAVCRFLIPALGLASVNEIITLIWAFTLFCIPMYCVLGIIAFFEIKSTYVIGFLYFLGFIGSTLLHMAWNMRAYRTQEIITLQEAHARSDRSLENDKNA